MLREYSWDMTGYKPKSIPSTPDGGITRYMAERIFQLEPEPPKAENINDYILSALREKELKYFSFFPAPLRAAAQQAHPVISLHGWKRSV